MEPINTNWTDDQGNHQGGQSTGIGFTIAWQREPLNVAGRNGAFILEVLGSCLHQIKYFEEENPIFSCPENAEAIQHIEQAIAALESRRNRRSSAGTLGTHQGD